MRCFTPLAGTRFYAGVDLHSRAMFVVAVAPFRDGLLVVIDRDGKIVLARNMPAAPEPFLRGCECMHCWYWLADTCREEKIAFVLGHAWAMKAVHGYKTKCDRKDEKNRLEDERIRWQAAIAR